MCQRDKVAGCAQRSLHIHDGVDVIVEEVYQPFDRLQLAAGVAVAKRLDLEQQHDLHDLVGNTVAYTTGMGHDKVLLQL